MFISQYYLYWSFKKDFFSQFVNYILHNQKTFFGQGVPKHFTNFYNFNRDHLILNWNPGNSSVKYGKPFMKHTVIMIKAQHINQT